MTDREVYLNHWTPTLGAEEAEKSWLEKEKMIKRESAMYSPDIQPYISQVDGSWITSRSRHRDHLKQHRMVEVGNDVSYTPKTLQAPQSEQRREAIGRAVYEKLRYK